MQCAICGRKDTECVIRKAKGMELCPKHITQLYRHGCFDDNTIYQPNTIELLQDHAEIVLKDRNCVEVGRALIDLDDVEKCRPYKWHIRDHGYVIASLPDNQKIHLHWLITGFDQYDGIHVVDHINRNPLDNRKDNLRIVTQSQNTANVKCSGIKRVPSGNYQVTLTRKYHEYYLGTFKTYEEAVDARRQFIQNYGY